MPINFIYSDSLESETTESFFSNQFLNARIDGHNPSNKDYDPIFEIERITNWEETHWKEIKDNDLEYEEDINQYITLSLAELVNPNSSSLNNQYLVDTRSDAGQIAINLENASAAYQVFRLNADFLLFHLGLFNQNTNILGDTYFDKGGSYYNSAACSLKNARGGRTGLSDVLEKLSLKFGKYVEILRCMKNRSSNFLSFHFKYTHEEMKEFQNQLAMECQKRKGS